MEREREENPNGGVGVNVRSDAEMDADEDAHQMRGARSAPAGPTDRGTEDDRG